jgi:MoxR-like ATPase
VISTGGEWVATENIHRVEKVAGGIRENVGRVMVGKAGVVELVLVALLCEGHVLFEDVPGVGKTTMAKTLARSLDMGFQRIQFTPDLLPTDVTGLSYYDQKEQEFRFRPGPVFSNLLLADEINRATPRTQSALLEAMEERHTTVDGNTRPLPRPFLVLATQNPVELEGTFPLPEAQLDRFMMRVEIGYPDRDEELEIARRFVGAGPLDALWPVASVGEVEELAGLCREVYVSEAVGEYITDLVRATREHSGIGLGASPRATLALYRGSQALAAIRGRGYVLPDDIKELAVPVLGHRLIMTAQGRLGGRDSAGVVEEVLSKVPSPVEDEEDAAER